MQAADSPWMMRPMIDRVAPFAKTKHNEPMMLKIMPIFVNLTRPYLSANPPAATMNIPENKEVKLIAMFNMPDEIPKSAWTSGTIFTIA